MVERIGSPRYRTAVFNLATDMPMRPVKPSGKDTSHLPGYTSKGWDGEYTLVDSHTHMRILRPSQFVKNGKTYHLNGGRAPHKPGSSGFVHCTVNDDRFDQEFYPQVIGLEWLKPHG